MRYVDGYVIALPKQNIAGYRKMARVGATLWKKYGALEYFECIGDDLDVEWGLPFPRLLKLKRGETAVFSFIVYKSRAHRDRVNAKVMKDPRLAASMEGKPMPFDMKRMAYGGFKTLVKA